MDTEAVIIEIPELLKDKTGKKVIFTMKGLTIEKPFSLSPAVFIPAENICSFRYGINWIRGYSFVFGRQYLVQIQDFQNKVYSIKLNSYYRIRSEAYHKALTDIFSQLWHNYFVHNFNYYIDLYKINQEFELGGVKFRPSGISWDGGSLFWNEIALSNYNTYFMIHHRDNPKKNKSCNFKNDWNAFVLQSVLKEIVKEQSSYRSSKV